MSENSDIDKILSLLNFFTDKTKENGKSLLDLFKEVSKEKLEVENSYNIFKIVSDKWYFENFHTYIIASLLNPKEKHYKTVFLKKFLDIVDIGNKFSRNNLNNIIVETQKDIGEGIIDIFIYDENKNCIIIENKINNAWDQPDQINRYYCGSVNDEYNPVCIVYITPTSNSTPPSINEEKIKKLIIHLPAYNREDEENSLWYWLEDCANELVNKEVNKNNLKDIISDNDNSKIIELYTIIKQYQKLIKIDAMNENALKSLVKNISGSKEYLEALCTIAYTMEIEPVYLLFYFNKEKIKTSLEGLFNPDEIKIKNNLYIDEVDRSKCRVWFIKFEIKLNIIPVPICIEFYRWNNEFLNEINPFIVGVNYGFIKDNKSNININTLSNALEEVNALKKNNVWKIEEDDNYWIAWNKVDNLIKEIIEEIKKETKEEIKLSDYIYFYSTNNFYEKIFKSSVFGQIIKDLKRVIWVIKEIEKTQN
jgi:hypothetical protein